MTQGYEVTEFVMEPMAAPEPVVVDLYTMVTRFRHETVRDAILDELRHHATNHGKRAARAEAAGLDALETVAFLKVTQVAVDAVEALAERLGMDNRTVGVVKGEAVTAGMNAERAAIRERATK